MYDNLDPNLKNIYGIDEPNLLLWATYDSRFPKNSQNSIVESNLSVTIPNYAVTGIGWHRKDVGQIVDLDIDAATGFFGKRYELIDYKIVCTQRPTGDINYDCKVDFEDLAVLANNWLECNLSAPEACW